MFKDVRAARSMNKRPMPSSRLRARLSAIGKTAACAFSVAAVAKHHFRGSAGPLPYSLSDREFLAARIIHAANRKFPVPAAGGWPRRGDVRRLAIDRRREAPLPSRNIRVSPCLSTPHGNLTTAPRRTCAAALRGRDAPASQVPHI